MNERNVEALQRELTAAADEWWREWRQPLDWSSEMLMKSFAKYVAARGVLVPSVLTDEHATNGDAFGVREVGYDSGTWYEMNRDDMVYTLERIAKGEAPADA